MTGTDRGRALITRLLRRGEVVRFRVSSGSMMPMLSPGDRVGIRKKEGSYRFGDVVLLRDTRGFCLHRIIWTGRRRVVTKGDGMRMPDRPVRIRSVLGNAVWMERAEKRIPLGSLSRRAANILLGVLSGAGALAWRTVWIGPR